MARYSQPCVTATAWSADHVAKKAPDGRIELVRGVDVADVTGARQDHERRTGDRGVEVLRDGQRGPYILVAIHRGPSPT